MAEKQPWQVETEIYLPRLSNCLKTHRKTQESFQQFPLLPLSNPVDERGQAVLALGVYALTAVRVVSLLLDSLWYRWSIGMLISAPLEVRLTLEYRASIRFCLELTRAIRILEEGDKLQQAMEHCARLVVGSRVPIKLPHGEMSQAKSFSVMEFIRRLEDAQKGWLADYEFLCEACHPNAMQHMYFVMSSMTYDNWSNEGFKGQAHEILVQTIAICAKTVEGLGDDAAGILNECLAQVAAAKAHK